MASTHAEAHAWQPTTELTDEEVAQAWKRHWRRPTDDTRNALMEHYLPVVKYTGEWLATRLPKEVETDDIISAGIEGLRRAIDSFDPDRGVKFETYCSARVRGAVLDALRRMDWVPRLVRARANKLARSRDHLQGQLGRSPTDQELAAYMGLSKKKYRKVTRDAAATGLVSLDRCCHEDDGGRELHENDFVVNPHTSVPEAKLQETDLRMLVTRGLSKTERLVLTLYYYEEMTMKEVGAVLDMSESRVSQIHSSIINRLRSKLGDRAFEFLPAQAV